MGRRSTTTCKLCGGPATDKHPTLALCDGHFVNYNREAGRRTYQRSRDRAFEVLGRACVRCGFADPRALQIDHVFSDGAEHRRKAPSNHAVHRAVMADPSRFQILCANCNQIKKHDLDEVYRKDSYVV